MKSLILRVHRSAAAWSFFSTMLRVGANIFVLPFILHKLSPDDYAVWIVFGTIGGLASLLDLGFEQTITRMTSYAWGGATKFRAFGFHEEDEKQTPSGPNLQLLQELIATLKAYYFYVGLAVLTLLAVGGGIWIWFTTRGLDNAESLRLAWLVYAVGCWLNFVIGRWPALLTGIGAIREAQVASIISLLAYYVVVMAGLFAGLGIWSLVVGYVVMGFVARHWGKQLFKRHSRLSSGLPKAHFHPEIFQATWPNAWRTGLVGVGSFLTIQANTLICSAFLGLKTTAAYGLSFQLVNILFSLCNVWLAVKMPAINALRLQNHNEKIANVFACRLRLTLLSYVGGSMVILFAAPIVLHWLGSKTPLIPFDQMAGLLLIRFLELHQTQYSLLILTENHNPFLKPSLITGAATLIMSLVLTPFWGVWGLLISMGVVQLAFTDWWPVFRALKGLNLSPRVFFIHHYLRPRAWVELF